MAAADKHVYMPQIATTLLAVDDDGQVVPKMCGAALVVYELPVRAIYPNSDTVFGNVYKTPSAITRLSLFLWFMEICRMTAVTCYIETVVDGKWHELTKKCDPVLIRLWIAFSDNTQLVQFLATVEKLVPPTPCDDDVVSDRQGRQSPANLKQEEEDVVNEPSPDFIKTPTDLARAVSLVFVGRACKTFKEIDTRGPTFDNETLGPNALTEVFSACDLFDDEVNKMRWKSDRVSDIQSNYNSYVPEEGTFCPHITIVESGWIREIRPDSAIFYQAQTRPSASALLRMSLPHLDPPRALVEQCIMRHTRLQGRLFNDFSDLNDADFRNSFCTNDDMLDPDRGGKEFVDPINFDPIQFEPTISVGATHGDDIVPMKSRYSNTMMCKERSWERHQEIVSLDEDGVMFNKEEEIQLYEDMVVKACEAQSESLCAQVPRSFYTVTHELETELFPMLERAIRLDKLPAKIWNKSSSQNERQLSDVARMVSFLVELAVWQAGLDLTTLQANIYAMCFFGTAQVQKLHWGAQPGIALIGNKEIGKSTIGNAMIRTTPQASVSVGDAMSAKAMFEEHPRNPCFQMQDERPPKKGLATEEDLIRQSAMSKGYATYNRLNYKTGNKKRKSATDDSELNIITVDKRRMMLSSGNGGLDGPMSSRFIKVEIPHEGSGGTSRSLGDRVNSTHNNDAKSYVQLVLKTWQASMIVPWMLEANGGVIGGVDESMAQVFFAIYDAIMVDRFNSPKMGPREMRQVVNIAHGIMVSEITNSTFRGTSKPSNLKYIDILNVIRAGGMFLKMEHCVVAWLLIRPTADTSQTEARLLGALKDLVQFDSDGATPIFDTSGLYYVLDLPRKAAIVEGVKDMIPDLGIGLIETQISGLFERRSKKGHNFLKQESKGSVLLLKEAVDQAGVACVAENKLRDLLRHIFETDTDRKWTSVSFEEDKVLYSNAVVQQFMQGMVGMYSSHASDKHDFQRAVYFLSEKRTASGHSILIDHSSPSVTESPEYQLPYAAEPSYDGTLPGYIPVKPGGILDSMPRPGHEDSILYKGRCPKPAAFEIYEEALQSNFEMGACASAASFDAGVSETVNWCSLISGENEIGDVVFAGIRTYCDGKTEPIKYHVVSEPEEPSLVIRNPNRSEKLSHIDKPTNFSVLGDDSMTITLTQNAKLTRKGMLDFRKRQLYYTADA